jgi:hypothetical protein
MVPSPQLGAGRGDTTPLIDACESGGDRFTATPGEPPPPRSHPVLVPLVRVRVGRLSVRWRRIGFETDDFRVETPAFHLLAERVHRAMLGPGIGKTFGLRQHEAELFYQLVVTPLCEWKSGGLCRSIHADSYPPAVVPNPPTVGVGG